jgi:hypothetical protein
LAVGSWQGGILNCPLLTAYCLLLLLHRALLLVCAGKQLRLRVALFLDR